MTKTDMPSTTVDDLMRLAPWEKELVKQGADAVEEHLAKVFEACGPFYCIRDAMRIQLGIMNGQSGLVNKKNAKTLGEVVEACANVALGAAIVPFVELEEPETGVQA